MASILTEHVRQFGADSDPTDRILPELERLLKQRMRRKNLLSAPPSFLGYVGITVGRRWMRLRISGSTATSTPSWTASVGCATSSEIDPISTA